MAANFVNLKPRLDDPEAQHVMSLSMFQPTTESIARAVERCRNANRELWGVVDDGRILGVVGYYIRGDQVLYIANISVIEERRGQGIGRSMIEALREKHGLPIELETDDDAIGFYRKCGFEAASFEKTYGKDTVRRWKCTLGGNTMTKAALVTGAAGGIGYLTAKRLIGDGYTVWCVDRAPVPADLNGIYVQLDLNDDAGIVALCERIVAETGGVDVIVNNAGYGQYGAIETVPMETGRRQMEVNFFAPVRLIQLLAPSMRERGGGRIVNISSVAGKVYSPLSGWYCASKFALEGITDCLRIELKPFNIGVSLIEPSPIRTAWSEGAKKSLLEASEGTAYEEFAQKAYRLLAGATGGGAASDPEAVVKAIMAAINAKNPKPRYLAGKIARLSVTSKNMMGDRLFDVAMNSQLK